MHVLVLLNPEPVLYLILQGGLGYGTYFPLRQVDLDKRFPLILGGVLQREGAHRDGGADEAAVLGWRTDK